MRFSTMPDSEIISELCRRIKETRIQLGLSQIELAERAQVGAATIKRVELGESVTLSTLIGILRGLDRLHQLESILFDRTCVHLRRSSMPEPLPVSVFGKNASAKREIARRCPDQRG
jgi:transcriptional regulator with XRE-family HTH domain